ncbi:MAG: hypothetical protein GX797_04935 [Chloroflexi bacterium]|jgi:hypothetical protein|nr:hypothetical protein [Chloroflexota bacterium]
MKPEIIQVFLKENDGIEYLEFNIDDKNSPHKINLNSEDSQMELKQLFSSLLKKLIISSLEFDLQIDEKYKNMLFIEVSREYLKDLEAELKQVREEILKQLSGH